MKRKQNRHSRSAVDLPKTINRIGLYLNIGMCVWLASICDKRKLLEEWGYIPPRIVCYELAFQAMKTRIERLSFCVGVNSGMRWGIDGDDWADGRIAGSDGWGIFVRAVPLSLAFWNVDAGTLYDLVIALVELWGVWLELMFGVEDEFRASGITPFNLFSDWSDNLSRSFETHFWYFLQALSNTIRSCSSHVGKTCQSNRSWRA